MHDCRAPLLNPRQLEAFVATLRTGSLTRAGQSLGITQPSVSRLIADLESDLGFRLFRRGGRGLVATPEARRFGRAVETLYLGLDRLRETATVIRTSPDMPVTLGIIGVFARSGLLQAVRDLSAARPTLRLSVSVRTNEEVIDAVQMQQLDLGVVSAVHSLEQLHVLASVALRYRCIVPADHALAREAGPVDLERLADEPFVSLPTAYLHPDGQHSTLLEQLHRRARITSHSVPAVATLAVMSEAFALVDPLTAETAEALDGAVIRPTVQPLMFPVAVVARGLDALPEAVLELAEQLATRLQALAEPAREHMPDAANDDRG